MSDVSRKVTKDLIEFAARANLDIPKFADSAFQDTSGYVSWQKFTQLCKSISTAFGSDQWAEAYAANLITRNPIYVRTVVEVARFITEPRWLFWIAHKWVGPSNFRNQKFEYKAIDRNNVRLVVTLDERHEDFPLVFIIGRYCLSKVPAMLGLPDAIIEADISTHRATYTVILPPSHSLWARLRRAFKALLSTRLMIEELAAQDSLLAKNYQQLAKSQADLQKIRLILERKVADGTLDLQKTTNELESADALIRRSEARMRKAQEIAGLGWWSWNLKTGKIEWSEQVYRIFGVPVGGPTLGIEEFLEIVHPDDRSRMIEGVNSILNRTSDIRAEYRIIRSDGEVRYILDQSEIIRDATGNMVEMIGTILDITQQKMDELRLRQAKELADAANKAKSMFLANMSHELRTPLGAILGFSELAIHPSTNEEKRKQYVEVINRNGQQLVDLINDILDVSKLEAHGLNHVSELFDPNPVINDVVELLASGARSKGLTILVNGTASLPKGIISDHKKFRQILLNIIGNAIKFTEKGEISIHCGYQQRNDASYLEVTVTDTGKGIAPENHKVLFEPFSQEDISTTRRYGGTGLGLYLSRQLARMLGGDVTLVASSKSEGSVFKIHIQDLQEKYIDRGFESHKSATEFVSDYSNLQDKKILLVEDHQDIQLLIRTMLEKSGCRVDVAGTGPEGLTLGSQGHHDFILLDMQLPEMDGYSITKRLREKNLQTPIIALTAFASESDRNRCLEAGCDDFISKPLQERQLMDILSRWNSRANKHKNQ